MSNFECLSYFSFSRVILVSSLLSSGLFFFLELIYEHNLQSLFLVAHWKLASWIWRISCILKLFCFEMYEIDIIIYKRSVYMIETKFQMYFQKIYSFIKFRSSYTDFFQFTIEKYCIFLKILIFFCIFNMLKKTILTYRCSLFRCFVSFFIQIIKI